jgi:diaminopimelate decarboxylase
MQEMFRKLLPLSSTQDEYGIKVAGLNLIDLAKEYGTPLYLYDGATIRHQVDTLQGLLENCYPGITEVTYAAKAYFSLNMARKLAQMNVGVDVVSMGEMQLAFKAGMKPERVHVHGNNKSAAELEFAVRWGVQAIVVDNFDELLMLEDISKTNGIVPRIWLRITPGVEGHTHAYVQTGHSESKFGLPIKGGQAAQAIQYAASSSWVKLTGLHMHIGSQLFEVEPFQKAIELLLDLAESAHFIPEEICPGGGWGVPYTLEDEEDDPRPWTSGVCACLQQACERRGWPLPKVILEPGRWLVAKAGLSLYEIGTTKFTADGKYIIAVDGGMADNPRNALYQARYAAIVVNRPEARREFHTSVVGKFCESGDQIIENIMMPKVRRGEVLAVPVSGAYQISMSSNYNMASRPAVLWLEDGRVEVLQKRENPEERGWFMGE